MAIPAVNATYVGTAAPVAGGSTTLAFGGQSMQELAYIGTSTSILDGTILQAQVNFLDGTNALGFTPTAVLCSRSGGNAANTVGVGGTISVNNIAFIAQLTGAGTNGSSLGIVFMAMK